MTATERAAIAATVERIKGDTALAPIEQPAPPRGLVRKLAEVMAAVHHIPKRGRNTFHGYDYATEADIVAVVRQELAARQVMLIPQVTGHERIELGTNKKGEPQSPVTLLHMSFTFIDGETGECEQRTWLGSGQDGGDKGIYKAMTGAAKYFLMKTFLMPTGDDPEEVAERKEAKQREREADKEAKAQQREIKAPAGPSRISDHERREMVRVSIEHGWATADMKRLLAFHGFGSSTEVTVDKLPTILDAIKNGATVPHTPQVGVMAPENAAVV